MDASSLLPLLTTALYQLPSLAILIACIIYVSNAASIDGILMLMGQGVSLIATMVQAFVLHVLMRESPVSDLSLVISIIGGISMLGYISFTVGFFLMVARVTKLLRSKK